jgi:hypothetical protein
MHFALIVVNDTMRTEIVARLLRRSVVDTVQKAYTGSGGFLPMIGSTRSSTLMRAQSSTLYGVEELSNSFAILTDIYYRLKHAYMPPEHCPAGAHSSL